MPSYPKPEKGSRKREKEVRKRGRSKYTRSQAQIAIHRDNDQCAICWFKYGRYRRRAEVHHVYSRGRGSGDWRERYTSLLCVCKKCHPPPVQNKGASARLHWVEDILEQANANPINKSFKKVPEQ